MGEGDIREIGGDGRLPWIKNAHALWGTLPKLLACRAYTLNGPKGALAVTRKDGECSIKCVLVDLMDFLELPTQDDFDAEYASIAALQAVLEQSPVAGGILLDNLRLLGEGMALEEGALHLMLLRIVERLSKPFSVALNPLLLGCIDPVFVMHLDGILGLPAGDSERLLARDGALARSGLLTLQRGFGAPLEARLRLPQGLMGSLLKPLSSRAEAIRCLVPLARQGQLAVTDYPHHAHEVSLLLSHIDGALKDGRQGVNILLHGEPGVGKTELVSAIAEKLKASLFVIGGGDPEGERLLTPGKRLDRFRFAQGLVRSAGRTLLLVDEAEDLFPVWWKDKKEDVPNKALLNETLETNLVPTFWLTNRVSVIDEAFMRRFDLVLRITAPDRQRKAALLTQHVPALAEDQRWTAHAVAHAKMSPAVITRMGKVMAAMEHCDSAAARDTFGMLRMQYLQALGERATTSADLPGQEIAYGLAWLNPDIALAPVLERMRVRPRGRLLFHGAPGTGKTALAHHLADQIGRGILVKRGSDLMSMWVGETEKNLRNMFEDAQREGDVLLLDEADSFLSERNANQPRWQTTQTNELLTQMEAFEGIFICTTNLLDHLDAASLRRFDLKVGFNPLRPKQRLGIFRDACDSHGFGWNDGVEASIQQHQPDLAGLTPGDMAVALRKLRLVQERPQAQDLLEALIAECRYKSAQRPRMGFV